jgi:AraC-like DNA-binding protein
MVGEISTIAMIDVLLRGMAISLDLLLLGHLLSLRRWSPVVVAGGLFCATIPAKLVVSSPVLAAALAPWTIVLLPVAESHTVFFWWFALALFDDRFRWRRLHFAPFVVVALAWAAAALPAVSILAADVAIRLLSIALLLHILSLAVREFDGDLVDERRKFRVAIAVAIPMTALTMTASDLYSIWRPVDAWLGVVYAATTLFLCYVFVLWLTGIKERILLPEFEEQTATDEVLSPADRLDLAKLRRLVDQGICLEPGLSIGTLAERMSLPEHRLRRIINRGLGYRNFAAFLNDHRIEEAKKRLADPALAREQIIQHAYGLGYASLAPFNRAFRERVGVSPSEYRHAALGQQVEAA